MTRSARFPLVVGLDVSTQSVKALALSSSGIEAIASVSFGRDLPEYGAPDGFVPGGDPAVRAADPRMWLSGMELALRRLGGEVDLSRVQCVTGAAQQHGLVCTDAAGEPVFPLAPIWMDSSTSRECAEISARFGDAVRERTGSAPTERFTGPQARKAARDEAAWRRVAHCHCVASYLNSALIGACAPVDFGSASGQNLMDIRTLRWDEEIAAFTAPELLEKLPPIVPPLAVTGTVAPRFSELGLRPGVPVLVWSGDNPDSILGMGRAHPGGAVISLGTSDTFFAALAEPPADFGETGNLFRTSLGGCMPLVCFANGSLARERVRAELGLDRRFFDGGFEAATVPGNGGRLMLPWFEPEITPRVATPGVRCNFTDATPAQRVRALLESQALAMREHSGIYGDFAAIGVTGGASRAGGFLRIMANVFNARIERLDVVEAVALGAAVRALSHVTGEDPDALSARFSSVAETFEPDPAAAEIYAGMARAYRDFVALNLT